MIKLILQKINLFRFDNSIFGQILVPILQEALKFNNITCKNCFLESDNVRPFSVEELTSFRWCSGPKYIYILQAAFVSADPKRAKRH